MEIVNTHSDTRLSATSIDVFDAQLNNLDGINKLIEAGTFTFLINLFESQATTDDRQPEVCAKGLRCARRLLANKSCGEIFCSAGGVKSVIHLLTWCPDSSIIQLEGYQLLLTLINLFPPSPPLESIAVDDDWDAKVEDEGVLGIVHRMERPSSPRSWEAIGLTSDNICRLMTSICICLCNEGHGKQIKLQKCGLGLLAYFACEKIEGTVEKYHEGKFHLAAKQALLNFYSETEIIKTVSSTKMAVWIPSCHNSHPL